MPEMILGTKVFRAGETVYAYDHMAFCVRHAVVEVLNIYDKQGVHDDAPHTAFGYNLRALDEVEHGSVLEKSRDRRPFWNPIINQTMVFETLPEALADLHQRIADFRRSWGPKDTPAPLEQSPS